MSLYASVKEKALPSADASLGVGMWYNQRLMSSFLSARTA